MACRKQLKYFLFEMKMEPFKAPWCTRVYAGGACLAAHARGMPAQACINAKCGEMSMCGCIIRRRGPQIQRIL